jgi:hypothetical protein
MAGLWAEILHEDLPGNELGMSATESPRMIKVMVEEGPRHSSGG